MSNILKEIKKQALQHRSLREIEIKRALVKKIKKDIFNAFLTDKTEVKYETERDSQEIRINLEGFGATMVSKDDLKAVIMDMGIPFKNGSSTIMRAHPWPPQTVQSITIDLSNVD